MMHSPYVRCCWLPALLVGLVLAAWGPPTAAQEPSTNAPSLPDRMQMDAYLALFRGDEARDQEDPEQAAQAYREAVEAYRTLQSTYPDHQPSMVNYRLSHAERELAALPEDNLEPPPPAVDEAEFEREQIHAIRKENQYLRQKLLGLEDELERGEEPSPEHVQELGQLSQENQELSMSVRMLRKQLETERVNRTELRAAQQEVRELNTVVAKQRSQLVDQRERAEEVGSLRERVTELMGRNRQLELAIKGAEQEATTIRRLEDDLRVVNSKAQLLKEDRNRLANDLAAMTAREETLQKHRQELASSQAQAEKALAASLNEAQTFMARNRELEDTVALLQGSHDQLKAELAAARALQAESEAECADLEAELKALRTTHIEAESNMAELKQEALEARDLKAEMAGLERAHQAELASVRKAQVESLAAQSKEAARELELLMNGHAAALAEEERLREELLAGERERHDQAVSSLVAKHAADLDDLKGEMQALKADLQLALESPVPARLESASTVVESAVDGMEPLEADPEVIAVRRQLEEAELIADLLHVELETARQAVADASAEREKLAAKLADADDLRRRIALLTEERSVLQKKLAGEAGETTDGLFAPSPR